MPQGTKQGKALKQLRKATKLVNRSFRKNGPKSFKKGQGALLKVLNCKGGKLSSRELVDILGWNRGELKDVVRKAQRNGYVTIEDASEKRTYFVKITDEGAKLAEKRCKAQHKTADAILANFTDEEIDQLNALTEKIIVSCKDLGAHGKRKKGNSSKTK